MNRHTDQTEKIIQHAAVVRCEGAESCEKHICPVLCESVGRN